MNLVHDPGSAGSILFSWNDAHGRTALNSALLSVNLNNFQVVTCSNYFRAISETVEHVLPLTLTGWKIFDSSEFPCKQAPCWQFLLTHAHHVLSLICLG